MALTQIKQSNIDSGFSPSYRNMVINGAMQINQRGNSTGQTGSDYQMDRFKFGIGSLGTWSSSQSTVAPDGFGNSWKMNCTTANASPSASATLYLYTRLEGQTLQQIKKGTANAQPLTLSFWCRCNKTGNFQANLRDYDNTRQVGATVTINSANTWEYKTITFPADTTGVLDNDNAWSLSVEFWLDSGSDFKGGAVPTAWEAAVNTDRAAGTTLALGDSTSNEFYLTGVQLEVGEAATSFEHRPYGMELALCQRYYQKYTGNTTSYPLFGVGQAYSSNQVMGVSKGLTTTMRAYPTASLTGTWYARRYDASSDVLNNPTIAVSTNFVSINGERNNSGLTAGHACTVWSESGSLILSAEL